MPQTSPMNWFLFSNLIIFMMLMNSLLFSFEFILKLSNKNFILYSNKKWMW